MDECIFCKVASGEIPARFVYEDEHVVAFDDISPQAPVHTLVIPREHYSGFDDGISSSVLGAIFSAVPKVAQAKGVAETGYRVIINNGADANQTVKHLHVHIMGGRAMGHGMVVFAEE